MPKPPDYPEEIRTEAKAMFLRGASLTEIARWVAERTGRRTAPALMHIWSTKGHPSWVDERNQVQDRVNRQLVTSASRELIQRSQQQMEIYKRMTQKGEEHLETILPESAQDVIGLINTGIRGERQISAGLVTVQYIEKVVQIIMEEVQDDDVKRRIANRMYRMTEEILRA